MDEYMTDKEYYGQEGFKKYLHPFRDYLISGIGKHIDFKIFDFAAESILAPESQRSISLKSEINIQDLQSLEHGLTPFNRPLEEDDQAEQIIINQA